MLGRRYFIALAKQYAGARPESIDTREYAVWLHMVYLTVGTMQEFAPNFDRARFLAACGIEEHAPVSAH